MGSIHIARSQQHLGAFIENEVREGIRTGRFTAGDLVWREGMDGWKSLGEMAPQWGLEAPPPPLEAAERLIPGPPAGDALKHEGEEGQEPAWEHRRELGIVPAIIQTVKSVLIRPTETFARMKHTGGLLAPLLFAVLLNTAINTFVGLLALAGLLMMSQQEFQAQGQQFQVQYQQLQVLYPDLLPAALPTISKTTNEVLLAVSILIWPLIDALGYFLGAGIMHLSLMLCGGARRPFETTLRATCYFCGSFNAIAILLDLIPGGVIGAMIRLTALLAYLAWYSYGGVIAFKEAHGIGAWRVIIAATVATIAGCCLLVVVIAILSPFALALTGMTVKAPTP